MTDDALISIGFVFLIAYVAQQISLRRLLCRLRQIDTTLWMTMGSPMATYFTKFHDYNTSRPRGFDAPLTEYNELSLWLEKQCYKQLRDGEIIKNAALYRLANQVQIIVSLLALCVILYAVVHR